MKNLILILTLLLVTAAAAIESQGVYAKVELVSGATQYAQFLGIQQDTVSLGGNIKGKFTVVRIAKDRFKSIIDGQGNDLLNQTSENPSPEFPKDTTILADSVQSADTTVSTDSIAKEPQPTFLDSVSGKHIFVSLERRSVDSVLDAQISPIIIRLLQESGVPVVQSPRTNFGYCREAACIRDSLALYGAASVYLGNITAGISQDSLVLQITYSNLQDSAKTQRSSKISLSVFNAMSDILSKDKLTNFIKILQGDSIPQKAPQKKDGPSYVRMESDPEGATIMIPGKDDICKTPCTFALQDTGKLDVYAYWNVNEQLWGIKKTFKPIPQDTTKFSVRLKKVKPELQVFTIPEGAYIYAGSKPLTPSSSPIGKSPSKYNIYEPGTSYIQIRKEGYRDTLVTFFASPTELTDVNVTLTPITNFAELEQQKQWIKERKKNFIGKTLIGSSIAPLIAGGIMTYLATRDYDDAKSIKKDLEKPATFNGANYQAKVKENHDLVDKGDRKMIIGGSLIGLGGLMLGAGILLTF